MATPTTPSPTSPYVVDDCRGVLQVLSDGSITRSTNPSFTTPVHDDGSILHKDVLFDPVHDLRLRLYRPSHPSASGHHRKLPILYYIHGGGFCIGSRTWPNFHNYCLRLASDLEAVVVAPDYRLAPEDRLPAAVEDGFAAVRWLREQALRIKCSRLGSVQLYSEAEEPDSWLAEVADFGRVFVAGDSAGGNIAHHLAVRLGAGSAELGPVRVRGYVLLAPFFGGTVLTRSEAEGPSDAFLNLEFIHRYWRLSIPVGETMDHPLVNPFGPASPPLEQLDLDPMLVVLGGSDLLKDRVEDYVKKLKSWGKKVEYVEFEGKQHGFNTIDPDSEAANELMLVIKQFITVNSG